MSGGGSRLEAPEGPRGGPVRSIGILTTDDRLIISSWDAALSSMTGITAAAAAGRRLDDVVPDLESRGLLSIIRNALETGAAHVLAPALHGYLIPCPPSAPSTRFSRMQQRVVVGPLREDDRTVGLAIAVEDVTERLELEHQLATELRHANPALRLRAIERLGSLRPVDGHGPLPAAMGDDDWQVRRSAVQLLAERRDPEMVDALVAALRDGHRNFSVLSSALQLLTMTGVDLTSALVDLLHHPEADLRIQAALALGTQPRQEAVDALLTALDDPDQNVRFHAIEALGKLGPASALERLAAISESGDFFLAFPALEALARINDPAVAPRIVPLLEDALVGDQAAEALGHVGDEDAVAPLAAALDHPHTSPASIVDALVAIHRRYEEMFHGGGANIEDLVRRSISASGAQRVIDASAQASGASLRQFVVVLGWLRTPAVERALTHMLGMPAVHRELIEAIVRFGAPMVDRLVEQVGTGDFDTRHAAVVALGRIGDTRAVPALVDLLDSGDRQLLVPAASALARLGDARAFGPLLQLLGDEELAVRQAAIGALNSIGHPDMGRRVLALLEDADPRVRESAVKIAGYFGYSASIDALLARCLDPDEPVRAAALEHVAYLDDERALPLLVSALERDTPRARAAAARALAHVESPQAIEQLRRALGDPDPWVRYFSVASLGRRGDRASLAALERLATDDELHPVRIAAVSAIGAIGAAGGDAAVRILAACCEGADDEVAVAAVRALGLVDTPSALEPLRRALSADNPERRAAAAEALAESGAPAVDLLKWTAAVDSDPAVIRAALGALARIGESTSAAAGSAIAAVAAVASDPLRRADAVTALARLSAAKIPLLGECLSSRDPHVRRAVVDALGRLSHPTASSYVRAALEDSDAAVRRQAVTVLSQLGSRGLARSFAELARTDPSETVRRAAGAALRRGRRQQDAGRSEAEPT